MALFQALQQIAHCPTPEAAQALAAVVPFPAQFICVGVRVCTAQIEDYLFDRVEALTGTRYSTTASACIRAAKLAPAASSAAAELQITGGGSHIRINAERLRLSLFWGVILRLDQLEGPPPADPGAFYSWCQLEAYRAQELPPPFIADVLAGRMGSDAARALLQLPATGPLDPAAIRSTYRSLVRQHHPDSGGDRERFEQLTAARDQLLLEIA
jgi:hypothetical protein